MCTTVGQWVLKQVSTPGAKFSHGFFAKNCQNIGLRVVDSSKVFLFCLTDITSKLGFVTPIELPKKAVASFSGCTRS